MYFIRNDINYLVTQSVPLKMSKYPRTKKLFSLAMGALILCTTINKINSKLETIFTIKLSRYDGFILNSYIDIPCY